MNRERITALIAHLEAQPDEKFNMAMWFTDTGGRYLRVAELEPTLILHTCGTAACIAGHALALFNRPAMEPQHAATNLLGLSWYESMQLFMPDGYEEPDLYTRHDAIQVLKTFLETGEIRWPW